MSKEINQYVPKEEKIRYFLEKGPEWMANQLWLARKENHNLREDWKKCFEELKRGSCDTYALQEANNNLAEILSKNGIKPVQYIMRYVVSCERDNTDGEEMCEAYLWDNLACDTCEERSEITETVSFYGFSIEDGVINAIDEKFGTMRCSVKELRNEETGTMIYKKKGRK